MGNIFLTIAAVLYLAFLKTIYNPSPPQGGDAAMAYPFTIVLLSLLLFASLGATAGVAAWNGGFYWISPQRSIRLVWVASALVGMLLVSMWAALFRYEAGPVPFPYSWRLYTAVVPVFLPLLLLLGGAILVNGGWRETVPVAGLRLAFLAGLGMMAVGLLGGLAGWLSQSSQNATRAAEERRQEKENRLQDKLRTIKACDPTSFEVAYILGYTSIYEDAAVREKALEKIKENPQWQRHLVDLIDQSASLEVIGFLAYNEVDDKALFAESVHTALLAMAAWIRRTISGAAHSADLYEDQFSFEIERALLVVDRFRQQKDYRPAVLALRAALDEPSEHRKPIFRAQTKLDQWLRDHL